MHSPRNFDVVRRPNYKTLVFGLRRQVRTITRSAVAAILENRVAPKTRALRRSFARICRTEIGLHCRSASELSNDDQAAHIIGFAMGRELSPDFCGCSPQHSAAQLSDCVNSVAEDGQVLILA